MDVTQKQIETAIFSCRRLAFVGVAKNSGKTTSMNWCLERAFHLKKDVLAISIGLDGEKIDALLGTPKPPVFVHEGQWIITTRKMVEISTATLKVSKKLGIATPLGETVVAKVIKSGEVILTGLRHRQDLRRTMDSLPIEHVFIDGAYGRVMAAHGALSDGILLSTGAVVGTSLGQIRLRTEKMVSRFHIPPAQDWRRTLIEEALEKKSSLLGGPNRASLELPNPSALVGLPQADHLWDQSIHGVAVVGLLSDRVAKALLEQSNSERQSYVIVSDPTAIQLSDSMAAKLKEWTIETYYHNRVVAISVNPTSVQGHRFALGEIEKELNGIWPEIPIFDSVSLVVG